MKKKMGPCNTLVAFILATALVINLVFIIKPSSMRVSQSNGLWVDEHYLQQLRHNFTRELAMQKSVTSLLSQPAINNHDFSYIHNPTNTCQPRQPEVLFVVPSAAENIVKRIMVRNSSRAAYAKNSGGSVKLLFFLGKPKHKTFQQKIDTESSEFGDIVQDGFDDTYKNIRLKAVSMLKWVAIYCDQAKYVIRTDDDVKVNPQKLVEALERQSVVYQDFIIGQIEVNWNPARDKNSKYFMSVEEYPHSTLPPFALGGLLGYPMSTVKLLYQAALRVKPLWLDDVYITGICAALVNVPLVEDPDFVFKHWSY